MFPSSVAGGGGANMVYSTYAHLRLLDIYLHLHTPSKKRDLTENTR